MGEHGSGTGRRSADGSDASLRAAARLAAHLLGMPNGFAALLGGDEVVAHACHGNEALRVEDLHVLALTVKARDCLVIDEAPTWPAETGQLSACSDFSASAGSLCAAPIRTADGEIAGAIGGFAHDACTAASLDPDGLDALANLLAGEVSARRRAAAAEAVAESRAASEQRLRAALDSLPLHFWVTDAAGRYVEQNIWDREAFGDLTGRAPHEADPPLPKAAFWKMQHERVLAGETVYHGSWRRHPGGEGERWVESIMAPLTDEGTIVGLVGMTVDRTAQIEIENRLKQSEARLTAAIDALPFPFFVCDADGRHVMQNRSDRELWGDAIGKTLAETGLPQEVIAHMPQALAQVRAGQTVRKLLRYNCNGQLRDVEEIYAPVRTDQGIAGFVGLAIDHTKRVEAEERGRQSEARLADHLATASDWLWETDETHRIVSHSGWPAHFEIQAETLLGQTRWDFADADPTTDPGWQAHVADMAAGRPFRRFVYAYPGSDDPRAWIEVSGNPIVDTAGVFRGYRGTARDVTEQRHAEQALREAHAKLEAMANSGLIGVTAGRGFLIEEANDAFLKLLGFDRSVLSGGLDWRQLVPPETRPDEVAAADRRRAAGDVYTTETAYRRADGTFVPVLLNSVVLGGVEQRWFALVQDLTPMKLAEARMRELAERDPLTGLANRHVLFERLAGDLGERRNPGAEGALMLLDLDRFKEINDSHGHEAGDQLLRLTGDRLKTVLRDTDTIARVGGDEFAVIVRGLREAANAADVAEKILAALRAPMSLDERLVRPDGSIGICLFPANGREPADLMKKADIALYAAKAAGRSTFRFFEPALVTQINQRRQIREALQQANAEESFSIELQPQVHVGTGRHVGLEALARWQLDGKPLMPKDFIGLAEETGLIVQLGRIVRRKALEAMQCLDKACLAGGSIAVNVGIVELEQPEFAKELHELLDELAIAPDRLAIELSETRLIDHRIDGVGGNLEALRGLGVSLVLDDFGSGHASLTWLRRLAFDGLKIDRCLIRQIDAENGDGSLVRGIIDMAHAMDLTVVAEGVETAAQLAFLAHHGCDIAQGFHLAAPLRLGDLAGYLEAGETPLGRAQ